MLGELVFCVDCDRARLSHLQCAPAEAPDLRAEPPRRMAIKKDTNRDPLCASCLDSRQARRRAEFMLQQARAPISASPPLPAATATSVPRKKIEFVRVVRSRPQETVIPSRPRKKRAPHKRATQRLTPTRRLSGNPRALERRFGTLILEIGLLRAQSLLDELKRSARKEATVGGRR